MSALLALSRSIDRVTSWLGKLVAWTTLAMVLIGSFNALARYLDARRLIDTQLSSNAFIELQWYLFSVVFLLGAAHTLRRDAHVRVDVFYSRLSARGRAWVDVAGMLLFLLPFCGAVVWLSWDAVLNSWSIREVSPDPGGLPRYPIKMLIPVAFALLALQGVSELCKRIAQLTGHAPLPGAAHAGGETP